ncbi:MAG TPA: sce7726 family protein [Candidatus Paceibacterota bacterium]|nr:sce7726 family protein [Candidatus Paceibacterota bacterium]
MVLTNDKLIRAALRANLERDLQRYRAKSGHPAQIFEELGVRHGVSRIDLAVINGVMHGYEIKSDLDTLQRLPDQVDAFSSVFDKLTLVVGKKHLYDAINILPDWWGVLLAKVDDDGTLIFQSIRKASKNFTQDPHSIAKLLWREEALQILENKNRAKGVRSKTRDVIYERLAEVMPIGALKERVRDALLVSREGWRSDLPLALSGD